jgi:hypothetical protein
LQILTRQDKEIGICKSKGLKHAISKMPVKEWKKVCDIVTNPQQQEWLQGVLTFIFQQLNWNTEGVGIGLNLLIAKEIKL